jgi:hypothetical protein
MPADIQTKYTTVRIDLEVYNSLLISRKILEQAYNRKFSLSETIQVLNQLSSDTIQHISSTKRELDEMITGRAKPIMKDQDRIAKSQ